MATTVYSKKTIELQDGTDVTLVPLAIGRLRRFMDAWSAVENIGDDAKEVFPIYINCCGIALEKDFEGKFEKTRDVKTVLPDDYREYLEDVLDMETIYEVLEWCGGLKLRDPKLLAEAAALAAQTVEDGTN